MPKATIYHNPRCSKSRECLRWLKEEVGEVEVVRYLEEPLTRPGLEKLLSMLGLPPSGLVRRGESLFRDLGLGEASEESILQAMVDHPELMERPVVVAHGEAVIGRPLEAVPPLFDKQFP